MKPQRPDPEQLLKQLKQESKQKGKLKIFFGACAGVGKTFAMLTAAKEKIEENINVVVGIVETHGRQETAKLLEGIQRIPLRVIEYHGIKISELDLDAALEQAPDILMVDELAHTNPIGSRHPKRWQDVQELLERGIDVYTTLNVQHLESLNDIVAQLTGIHVKETIPDSLFDNADEIVLVDVPSEVILERLSEGKVYLGELTRQRAIENFFKIENLIALREIALRRTAERVDALRDIYKKYQTKPLALSEKILVCIGPGPLSTKLVRLGKQLAIKLKVPWTVLHIENAQHYPLDKEEQNLINKTLHLAEQLGAKSEILEEIQTANAILSYAKENNFTIIILGKLSKPKWKKLFSPSLVYEIIEKSGNIDIYVVTEDAPFIKPKEKKDLPQWRSYLNAILIIFLFTLFGLPAKGWIDSQTVLMTYLAAVVYIAATSEKGAAIFAVFLSILNYNFFFMQPFYSFTSYAQGFVTLIILLITALMISSLTSRLRQQNLFAKKREKYLTDLYALSRKLIMAPGKIKIAKVVSQHISEIFDCAATIWLPDGEDYLELVSHPGIKAELKEESVAHWAYKNRQIAGLGTNTMPSAKGFYIPLSTGEAVLGVLGIIPKDKDRIFSIEENMLLDSLAIQTASALQRVKTQEQKQKEHKEK